MATLPARVRLHGLVECTVCGTLVSFVASPEESVDPRIAAMRCPKCKGTVAYVEHSLSMVVGF